MFKVLLPAKSVIKRRLGYKIENVTKSSFTIFFLTNYISIKVYGKNIVLIAALKSLISAVSFGCRSYLYLYQLNDYSKAGIEIAIDDFGTVVRR